MHFLIRNRKPLNMHSRNPTGRPFLITHFLFTISICHPEPRNKQTEERAHRLSTFPNVPKRPLQTHRRRRRRRRVVVDAGVQMLGVVHRRRSRSRRGFFILAFAGPGGLGRKLRRGGQESTRDVLGDEERGTVGGSHCRRSHGSGGSNSSSGSSSGNSLYGSFVYSGSGRENWSCLYQSIHPKKPDEADKGRRKCRCQHLPRRQSSRE